MSPPRHAIGSTLAGRFRIDGLLGRGGMGAVFAATHLGLGHKVAVKLLMDEAAASPEAVARFEQEAQIVSRLVSPHVVRVHDMGKTEDGEPFIVMELLEGHDLASLVARPSALAIPAAVELVLEASLGVALAHASGLVHRDLKPANLFVARQHDGTAVVKVLDFGLSKLVRPGDVGLTQSAASFGTPQYMAPEQIMSAKHVDARCDQHALAMILFELLTKSPPYSAATPAALTVTIVTKPPPSARSMRAEVPRALDEALQRAMAKRPSDRFADLGAFARAVAPFASPRGAALAATIERTLAHAREAAVANVPSLDEMVTLPKTPTVGGVSSGRLKLGSSPLFWGLGAALFTAAVGATIAFVSLRARTASTSSPATLSAASSVARSDDLAPTGAPAAVTAAPTASATSDAASADAASSAHPATSSSAAPLRSPSTLHKPTKPAASAAPRDPNDPINVFGH